MKISAQLQSREGRHHVTLRTNDHVHSLAIPSKADGLGWSVNGGEGSPASNLSYRVKVAAKAKPDEIDALIRHTDRVAEIQNTLRRGTMVKLDRAEAVCVA